MKMLKILQLFLMGVYLGAQTAAPMKAWPYESGKWWFYIGGNFEGDYEKGIGNMDLFRRKGKEGEYEPRLLVHSGRTDHNLEILTEDGKAWRGKLVFTPVPDTTHLFGWDGILPVEGQPISYRLIKNFKPFFEERFTEPGETPGLKAWTEPPQRMLWEITPALSSDHSYSLDGGNTWLNMGSESTWSEGFFDFKVEEIQANPAPMMRFVSFHRMRRYVKYYTFGKGYHDDPSGTPMLAPKAAYPPSMDQLNNRLKAVPGKETIMILDKAPLANSEWSHWHLNEPGVSVRGPWKEHSVARAMWLLHKNVFGGDFSKSMDLLKAFGQGTGVELTDVNTWARIAIGKWPSLSGSVQGVLVGENIWEPPGIPRHKQNSNLIPNLLPEEPLVIPHLASGVGRLMANHAKYSPYAGADWESGNKKFNTVYYRIPAGSATSNVRINFPGLPPNVQWAYALFREGLDKERDAARTQLRWGGFPQSPTVLVPLPDHASTPLILRVRVRGQRNAAPPPPPPGAEILFDWVDYEITYE